MGILAWHSFTAFVFWPVLTVYGLRWLGLPIELTWWTWLGAVTIRASVEFTIPTRKREE